MRLYALAAMLCSSPLGLAAPSSGVQGRDVQVFSTEPHEHNLGLESVGHHRQPDAVRRLSQMDGLGVRRRGVVPALGGRVRQPRQLFRGLPGEAGHGDCRRLSPGGGMGGLVETLRPDSVLHWISLKRFLLESNRNATANPTTRRYYWGQNGVLMDLLSLDGAKREGESHWEPYVHCR